MKIKTWIKYYSPFLPPRCRKPRYELHEEYIDVELREISFSDFSPAFRVKGKTVYLYEDQLYCETTVRNIWGGTYTKFKDPLEALQYVCLHCSTYFGTTPYRDNRDYMVSAAEADISKYLAADGVLYVRTEEPMYEVMTYGIGNNHGGTFLNVVWATNSNVDSEAYFSALDSELAILHANEVAKARGDTDYLGKFKADIEVLDPTAVKMPRRQPQAIPVKQEALWTVIWESDKGRDWKRLSKEKAVELVDNLGAYGVIELHIFGPGAETSVEDIEG